MNLSALPPCTRRGDPEHRVPRERRHVCSSWVFPVQRVRLRKIHSLASITQTSIDCPKKREVKKDSGRRSILQSCKWCVSNQTISETVSKTALGEIAKKSANGPFRALRCHLEQNLEIETSFRVAACLPPSSIVWLRHKSRPRAGIMEADDRQVTTVFTVHRHSTNRVS